MRWLKSGNAFSRFNWDWFSSLTFPQSRFSFLPQLLKLFSRSDQAAETLLHQKISELRASSGLSEQEQRWLDRLKDLAELRGLVFGQALFGKKALKQAFAFSLCADKTVERAAAFPDSRQVEVQDITETATLVSDLYWKLFDTAAGHFPDLAPLARQLYFEIFQRPFEPETWREEADRLVDTMQKERGLPFLVLNLIKRGDTKSSRQLTAHLLTLEGEIEEDIRSALYWLSELHWFTQERKGPLSDFDSSIRYLYHLCFTNPERAGFLEIDSQFFSQFEMVNELAREGFLFRETLVEKILSLWGDYEGFFDYSFQVVLETMTQRKSKIYDERGTWERFWLREKHDFSREYLYVVEGNLFYAGGHFDEARTYYEKALKLNPALRPALLNVLFCYAKLGMWEAHQLMVDRVTSSHALFPACLSVIGNSYLLLGDEEKADAYYEDLRKINGWERKTAYYKSTFCFENGLNEAALKYAKEAYQENPNDSSVSYHLSLCFNALGEKTQALAMLEGMEATPDLMWLNYYRFTLERDAGKHEEAAETLLKIPLEYFQEPEELSAAVEFARSRRDFVLLRHLRVKKT